MQENAQNCRQKFLKRNFSSAASKLFDSIALSTWKFVQLSISNFLFISLKIFQLIRYFPSIIDFFPSSGVIQRNKEKRFSTFSRDFSRFWIFLLGLVPKWSEASKNKQKSDG